MNTAIASCKKPIGWEKDAVGNGRCSADILLDWYTAPGNLHHWRGDIKGGVTKEVLANEIVALLNIEGIAHQDSKGKSSLSSSFCILHSRLRSVSMFEMIPKILDSMSISLTGIQQKLREFQETYNKVMDWKNHTGQGILAEDELKGEATVKGKHNSSSRLFLKVYLFIISIFFSLSAKTLQVLGPVRPGASRSRLLKTDCTYWNF